ncbi:MAG: D-aminoacyl-tRNA deacylase [Armatimonadaceae bacterium]
MRAVLQRVLRAQVRVGDETTGAIEQGILALVGVAEDDTEADAVYIADKIADLRLFDGAQPGDPERSLSELGGGALVVSQFTLLGDCRKGRRPSWSRAARPEPARALYEAVTARLRARDIFTATGTFQAEMQVELVNDGPFTVLLDSKKDF